MSEPAPHAPAEEPPDEGLPPESDPTWDETTADTLALLRTLRREHRRARMREAAYWSYVATLAVGVYVAPYVVRATRQEHGTDGSMPAGLLPGIVAAALLVLVALVRDGLWRGPVLLDPATAGWLLPLPIRREALLQPRLNRALVTGALLGAALGGVGGVLLRLAVGGSVPLLALAGAAGGCLVMVLGVAAGALAEAAGAGLRTALRRIGTALWALPAVPVALALVPADRPTARGIATALLWSGPWGWAVQPLAAALHLPADAAPATFWPLSVAGAAAVAAVTVVAARQRLGSIDNALLRVRAATVSAVTQSVGTLQPRRARLLVEAAQGRVPDTRRRLPVPRWRPLLLPWRDATALLRSPTRLVWGLLWFAVATPLGSAAGPTHGLRRLELAAGALLAGYLAVAQLVEGARLDADDSRVLRGLPLGWPAVVLGHVVTPLAVLLLAGAAAVPVLALAGPTGGSPLAALGLLGPALPALVGGGLVSAYRGDVPLGMLYSGAPSPTGDPGPLLLVLWYVRGPLAAIVLLVPFVLGGPPLVTAGVAAAAMIGWAVVQARRVLG
jgi:hypothetical protein